MSFGIQSFIGGTAFDAINTFTEDYVIDVLRVSSSGSQTYPTGDGYKIDAYAVDSPDTYQGGGTYANPSTVSVKDGKVSWTTNGPATVIVVMKND